MATYDVIVVGLGAHGSSALAHCAKRGARCLGLERFKPDAKRPDEDPTRTHTNPSDSMHHSFGSSHGRSRIIRQAYFEHPVSSAEDNVIEYEHKIL